MRIIIHLFLLFLVAACNKTSILDKKTQNKHGDNYYIALANGYNELAKREMNQFDWHDSNIFANKGLKALKEEYVAPTKPNRMEIPDNLLYSELVVARDKMQIILSDDTKFKFPYKSARLQTLYDYWIEQVEENWQDNDIARFRDEFWHTYEALITVKSLTKEKYEPKKDIRSVYFDYNRHNIDKTADKTLNNLAVYLIKLQDYKLILEGHTDPTGTEKYNDKLAQARIDSVKSALIKKGVPEDTFLKEDAYGENRLKIKEYNAGTRDRLNRRVEIYIIPKERINKLSQL